MRLDQFVSGDVIGRLGDSLLLMTVDGTILDANAAALELYGYSREKMLSLHLRDIRAPRFREHVPAAFRGVTGPLRAFETAHVRSDGSHFPVEVRTIEVADGDGTVVLCAARDITHRQDAEASLRLSHARFDNIAATIPGVLYEYVSTGPGRGGLVFVGPGSDELFGLDEQEMLADGDAFRRLIHPGDLARFIAEDDAVQGEGVTFRIDFRIITPVGEIKWIYMASRQLPSRPDVPHVWCGFMLDITERKLAEERLLKRDEEMARLNAELSRVAGSDALTGLASRRNFYDVLDRGHAAGDEVLATFADILDAESHADYLAGRRLDP